MISREWRRSSLCAVRLNIFATLSLLMLLLACVADKSIIDFSLSYTLLQYSMYPKVSAVYHLRYALCALRPHSLPSCVPVLLAFCGCWRRILCVVLDPFGRGDRPTLAAVSIRTMSFIALIVGSPPSPSPQLLFPYSRLDDRHGRSSSGARQLWMSPRVSRPFCVPVSQRLITCVFFWYSRV